MLNKFIKPIKSNLNLTKEESSTIKSSESNAKVSVPKGIYIKCSSCKKNIYKAELKANFNICPLCGAMYALAPRRRLSMIVDKGSFVELETELKTCNPLEFEGYEEKIQSYQEKTEQSEGVVVGEATIEGYPVMIGVMDGRFMMGSMGSVVGEKLTRLIEAATKKRYPLILFTASGGARMQEGILSLMQMAKTSSALGRHQDAGLLYISVLTDPTTGGVTASFAMLGDIILAEPDVLVGFAGPRVIEQTIKQKLPEGFQRSEFSLEHGMVDAIVERVDLRKTLAQLISYHEATKEDILSGILTKGVEKVAHEEDEK